MTSTASRRWMTASLACTSMGLTAIADDQRGNVGYLDLIARIGQQNAPTGAGIEAGQTEAGDGNGNYAPLLTDNHFTGKTFVLRSGSSGTSSHATTVGRHYYGDTWSVAPGILDIGCWEANHWIQSGFLGYPNNPPLTADVDLFNCSWIGTGGAADNPILRRADYAIDNQDIMIVCGVNNNAGPLDANDRLLSHSFNSITVGCSDGQHHFGNTLAGVDGPGRMKPEIVVPENTTSWATAVVSGIVADLLETARTWPGLDNNPNADRSEVIRAVLLGGAHHRNGWSNNPGGGANRGVTSRPLDPIHGVDEANINISHMIHTGLEQDASNTIPMSGSVEHAGWDLMTMGQNQSRYLRLETMDDQPEVSVLLAWNRLVADGFGSYTMPNIDLELFEVDENGILHSLRGALGKGVFGSGNVASVSVVDNVEHLFIRDLVPGCYVIRVSRGADGLGDWDAALAWHHAEEDVEPAPLTGFNMVRGVVLNGGLPQLLDSDDDNLHVRSGFGTTFTDLHSMEIQIDAETTNANRRIMRVVVESRTNATAGTARVRIFNHDTNQLDLLGTYPFGTTEIVREFMCIDPVDYVDTGGEITLNIRHTVFVPIFAYTFQSFFDQVEVTVN